MNYKLKRILSLLLVAFMFLGIVPTNTKAAVPLANWEESKDNSDFWPTPPGVTYDDRGLTTTPWVDYDIGFQGFSVDGEGRTVINLKLMAYSSADPNTVVAKYNYQYAQFKVNPELDSMIDWDKSFVGTLNYQNDSTKNSATDKIKFSNSTPAQQGVRQVTVNQLVKGGSFASQVWNNPIKLVLKDGITQKNLGKDYLIQSRFLNLSQNRYFAKINRKLTTGLNGYNAYTFSTIVPGKSSIRAGEIENRKTYNYAPSTSNAAQIPLFTQRTVLTNYDEENHRLVIFHGYIKQASDYTSLDSGNIGYRLSFDSRFSQYLKPDENGEVGFVTMRDTNMKPYSNTKQAPLKMGNVNKIGETNVFQLGSNAFKKTDSIENNAVITDDIRQVYFHSAATLNNLFTVSVFNIDEDKLMKESFSDPNKVLESFALRVAFILDTPDVDYNNVTTNGWSKYSYTADEDIKIPAGGKITITTDKLFGSSLFGIDASGDNYVTVAKQLLVNIGGNEGMTYLMPSTTGEYRGLTAVQNTQKARTFEIPFREGQTIKARQTIDVLIPMDVYKEAGTIKDDNAVNIYFNGDATTATKTAKISSVQRNKIKPARTLENSDKLAGVVFDRTLMPVVDEIFTDSTTYTGHSLYQESMVTGFNAVDTNKKETVTTAATPEETTVKGVNYQYTYKFTNTDFAKPMVKDQPIEFFNQDDGRLASETVTEQVQAKVNFDLNGGNIAGSTTAIEKIAPLNEKYSNDPAYQGNGFEGPNIKYINGILADHNGEALKEPELGKRQYPGHETFIRTQDPVKGTLQFLGWSTKALSSQAEVMSFAKAETLTDISDWKNVDNGSTVYRFTETSPIDTGRTVYAVYGDPSRVAENMKQSYDEAADKQGITGNVSGVTTSNPLATGTVVKLVDKDGNPINGTDGKQITATVDSQGKFTFPLTGLTHNQEVYFVVEEPNKFPSEKTGPVKLDLQAPTEVSGKELTIKPDLFSYMDKITGSVTDPSRILKVTVKSGNGNEIPLKYSTVNNNLVMDINDDTLKQLGEAKTYIITIYDSFGNKATKELGVSAVLPEFVLKVNRPRTGSTKIFVEGQANVSLKIEVIRNGQTITLDSAKLNSQDQETINLTKSSEPFKLAIRDKIRITGSLSGYKDAVYSQTIR
ncbi:hypothetical protein [Lagierella sp.]|uniref:hypothetical protein n=1 Tax=Lagierella sp. TaxID=2849657 RepID=UPI0026313262|nr:hypothetical protein [Lagierella sp.]